MKRLFLFAALSIGFYACDNGTAQDEHDGHDHTNMETTNTTATDNPAAASMAQADPVCKMERTADWTEHVVNGTDTTWFCSPHCKEAYVANPDKYKL